MIFRWFLRLRWWFILLPAIVASLAIYFTKNLTQRYNTDMTIYTGVISNYDPAQSGVKQDWNMLNNSIQNIINTIKSKETFRILSIQLYARLMIYGNPKEDNTYIKAKNYQELYDITPPAVRKLIDKRSEQKTIENLMNYEKPQRDNFIYGLFNWSHPYFSYTALKDNIKIKRLDNTDILQVSYESDDPGITFQTLEVLSKIFSNEYKQLQYSSTNNGIEYFESELKRLGAELRLQEDSLTNYNVENRVVNYEQQSESFALLEKEFSMRSQEVLFDYNNTKAALAELESRLDDNIISIKSNSEFLKRLDNLSTLNYDVSQVRTAGVDSMTQANAKYLSTLSSSLKREENALSDFMEGYIAKKYTKDGYPNSKYVAQWIDELIKFKRAEAELKVVENFQREIDRKYTLYSPIGSELKRKERSINFTEQSYLSILSSLNEARLRLKSLEMNSAVLKVINPPNYPLTSLPSKRKVIVLGSYVGTLIFIFGFFLLVELLDRTYRDRFRTERLTKGKVIGAFARPKAYKKNAVIVEQRLLHVLANNLYGLFRADLPFNLINVVTFAPEDDTKSICKMLEDYWSQLGINTKSFISGEDFKSDSREYLIGQEWKDIVKSYDLSMVAHAPLSASLIPTVFLQEGLATLLILRADSMFSPEDEMALNELKERMAGKPLLICLTYAERYVVEEFTGLLPPYTFMRRLSYRLSNFGLTSRT